MVNNYYRPGPSTSAVNRFRIVTPYKTSAIPFGKFFLKGNYVDGWPNVTADNSLGVLFNQGTTEDKKNNLVMTEFTVEPVVTQSAEEAYQLVLKKVGATAPARDTLDQRVINDVINRTGKLIDVQGGFPHGTEYELTIHAWPSLRSLPAPADTDKDGMPDEWEKKNGLNPRDASDAPVYKLDRNYTNIEVYLNSLIK